MERWNGQLYFFAFRFAIDPYQSKMSGLTRDLKLSIGKRTASTAAKQFQVKFTVKIC